MSGPVSRCAFSMTEIRSQGSPSNIPDFSLAPLFVPLQLFVMNVFGDSEGKFIPRTEFRQLHFYLGRLKYLKNSNFNEVNWFHLSNNYDRKRFILENDGRVKFFARMRMCVCEFISVKFVKL